MVKLDHLTLPVGDYQAARDWYVKQLGLSVEFEIPEQGVAAVQDSDGFTMFLEQTEEAPQAGCVLYFQVDNVDEAYEELTRRGVEFTAAPAKRSWGYGAELADPDGYRVRLWDAVSMEAA